MAAFPSLCVTGGRFSPSLVALEVDSEEDSAEPKSPLSSLSSDVEKSEDTREAFHLSPDVTCTRSQSSSSAPEPNTKVKHLTIVGYISLNYERLCLKCYNCSLALSRTLVTSVSDCVPIPTHLPKSLCVQLVLPVTVTLQT